MSAIAGITLTYVMLMYIMVTYIMVTYVMVTYVMVTYVMNVAEARKDYVCPVKVRNATLHTSPLRNVIETNVMSLRRNVTSCISYFCYKGRRDVHGWNVT